MNNRPYILENTLSKVYNKKISLIIIKQILYYIFGEYDIYIKEVIPYSIDDAFTCYVCSYKNNNYFNYKNCCSKECLSYFNNNYDNDYYYDSEYDSEYDEEQYITNRRMDCFDDFLR